MPNETRNYAFFISANDMQPLKLIQLLLYYPDYEVFAPAHQASLLCRDLVEATNCTLVNRLMIVSGKRPNPEEIALSPSDQKYQYRR